MYDRTGLSAKCTLIETGFKIVRTGTKAKFRPFVDALVRNLADFLMGWNSDLSNTAFLPQPNTQYFQRGLSKARYQYSFRVLKIPLTNTLKDP